MSKINIRNDDFETKRSKLKNLSDDDLKSYFWELAEKVVDPLVDLARKNTSPAIERSVLLRMGFSSLEAKVIVEKTIDNNLMGKGAGHVVYRLSKIENIDIRTAGIKLMNNQGWDKVVSSFEVISC